MHENIVYITEKYIGACKYQIYFSYSTCSKQNDDNLYKICNDYIKLSIVFHPMAIFLGSMENQFLPGI